jgi:hypothetical protein
MKRSLLAISIVSFALIQWRCLNPFAPGLDTSPAKALCDPTTIEGLFRCVQVAYTFKDTTVYAPLLDERFVFSYPDEVNPNIEITWGRDAELQSTFNLFQNAQRIDLIWNNVISESSDSSNYNIVRGFNLTVTLNPAEIYPVSGYANLSLKPPSGSTSTWKIVRWRDESNF